jgi:hypothetical protein
VTEEQGKKRKEKKKEKERKEREGRWGCACVCKERDVSLSCDPIWTATAPCGMWIKLHIIKPLSFLNCYNTPLDLNYITC